MKHKELSIAIVGGGIGGLTAALSLLRVGLDVHVYERSKKLSEVGAGIQVSPNASRILHGFGLADALASMGVKPLAMHQRRWDDGRTLLRTPLAEAMEAAFGFPHYQMHRADLLNTLACALPAERLRIGHRFTALEGSRRLCRGYVRERDAHQRRRADRSGRYPFGGARRSVRSREAWRYGVTNSFRVVDSPAAEHLA